MTTIRPALRSFVLQALVTPAHGLEVIRRLRERSSDAYRASPGSIYPALHLLEQQGLVRSWKGPSPERGGRRRRYYELTLDGVRAAEEQRAALGRLVSLGSTRFGSSEAALASRRVGRCLELSAFLIGVRRHARGVGAR
jgi:PadR family transcriptional regulator PadR